MLIHIKTLCEEISNELGLIPAKKQIVLNELTQLRNATKINDPDCPGLICIGSRPGMGKYYRKAKEILSMNVDFFEKIAVELAKKKLLTTADIQRIKAECSITPISF